MEKTTIILIGLIACCFVLIFKILNTKYTDKKLPKLKMKSDIVGESRYIPLENKKEKSPIIPESELDDLFSELELDIDYENGEDDNDEYEDSLDVEGLIPQASGISFEELIDSIKTADRKDATEDEKKKAGKVLYDIRDTDLLEQIVSGKPDRSTSVINLINSELSAFYKSKQMPSIENDDLPLFDVTDIIPN